MTPRSTIWCSNQLSYVGMTVGTPNIPNPSQRGKKLRSPPLCGIFRHEIVGSPSAVAPLALHPARPRGPVPVLLLHADVPVPPPVHHEIRRSAGGKRAERMGDHGAHRAEPRLDGRAGRADVRAGLHAHGIRRHVLTERDHRHEGLGHEPVPDACARRRRGTPHLPGADLFQQFDSFPTPTTGSRTWRTTSGGRNPPSRSSTAFSRRTSPATASWCAG